MDELGAWQAAFGIDNAKIFQAPPAFALYAFAQATDGKLLGVHDAACKCLVSAANCNSVSRVCSSVSRVCRDELLIGDRDLGTSNERRENSDDGLDVLTRSMDRRIEAALRDMSIILDLHPPD